MKNNKVIAEFMGIEEAYNPNGNDWVLKTTTPDTNGDTDILESLKDNELQYHSSWDWLMPVVVKLFDDEYNEFDGADDLSFRLNDTLLEVNLDSLHSIVVEFINEYNKTI